MLLSIVIPTWQRQILLAECVSHIIRLLELSELDLELGRSVEIVIVSDGQDNLLQEWNNYCRVIELGLNWSSLIDNSFGIAPLLVGYLVAKGVYIMPWCDDERALDDKHIDKLLYSIMECNADFVYPQVKIWRNGDPYGPETNIIGKDTPEYGQITHYMFKRSNLYRYGFPDFGTHPVDWALVNKWMEAGADWKYLEECTFEHRLDQ